MKIKTLVIVLTIFFLHGSEKPSPEEPSSKRLKTEVQAPSIEEQLKNQPAIPPSEMRFSYPVDIYRFLMNRDYSPIKTMPLEVAVRMAQFLPPKDLAHLAKTSNPMRDVAKLAMTKLEFNNKPIDQINAALDRYAGPQLKTLIINSSNAQGLHWNKIAECINLVTLSINNCQLTLTELPPRIAQLTQLEVLGLNQNNLSQVNNWNILPTSLQHLFLGQCQLTLNELPPRIAQLTQLQKLGLTQNNLSQVNNWNILNNLPQLKDLYIQQSGVHQRPDIRQTINVHL